MTPQARLLSLGLDASGRPFDLCVERACCTLVRYDSPENLPPPSPGHPTARYHLDDAGSDTVSIAVDGAFGPIVRDVRCDTTRMSAETIYQTAVASFVETLAVVAPDEVIEDIEDLATGAGVPYVVRSEGDAEVEKDDGGMRTVFLLIESPDVESFGYDTEMSLALENLFYSPDGYRCDGRVLVAGRVVGSFGKASALSMEQAGLLSRTVIRPDRWGYVRSASGKPMVVVMVDVDQDIHEAFSMFENVDIFKTLRE